MPQDIGFEDEELFTALYLSAVQKKYHLIFIFIFDIILAFY